jgi:hypothetical protein
MNFSLIRLTDRLLLELYGILASAFKATHKVNIDSQIGQVVVEVEEKTASLLNKCPSCKTGELHTVASFDQRGPPANWFNKIRKQNNKRQVALWDNYVQTEKNSLKITPKHLSKRKASNKKRKTK